MARDLTAAGGRRARIEVALPAVVRRRAGDAEEHDRACRRPSRPCAPRRRAGPAQELGDDVRTSSRPRWSSGRANTPQSTQSQKPRSAMCTAAAADHELPEGRRVAGELRDLGDAASRIAASRSSFVGKRRKIVATPTPARSATSATPASRPCSAKTARAASRTRPRLRSASARNVVMRRPGDLLGLSWICATSRWRISSRRTPIAAAIRSRR